MKKSLIILALLLSATFFSAYAKKESVCSVLQGKNISILGDSYSTFIGWIPQGYAVWYNPTSNKTDVHQVEDTWWWQLCDKTDCTLLVNSSYSGSTIGNTGYKGADATHSSFITRMKKDMGQECCRLNHRLFLSSEVPMIVGQMHLWANHSMIIGALTICIRPFLPVVICSII